MTMQEAKERVDRPHIERRVGDWKKRIANLYATMKTWLDDSDYSLQLGAKLTMYEGFMAQFDIPPTDIDTADVYKGKRFVLTVKPKGLWVIGANGIIDVLTTQGNYFLIDSAEQFEKPNWKLFNGDKKNGLEFSKQVFFQLLK